jgi:hypothetical protein
MDATSTPHAQTVSAAPGLDKERPLLLLTGRQGTVRSYPRGAILAAFRPTGRAMSNPRPCPCVGRRRRATVVKARPRGRNGGGQDRGEFLRRAGAFFADELDPDPPSWYTHPDWDGIPFETEQ